MEGPNLRKHLHNEFIMTLTYQISIKRLNQLYFHISPMINLLKSTLITFPPMYLSQFSKCQSSCKNSQKIWQDLQLLL